MHLVYRWGSVAVAAVALSACGGGGGGSTNTSSPPVSTTPLPGTTTPLPSGPALSFSPSLLTATVEAGVSANTVVNATVLNPAAFDGSAVYALVVDDRSVILPAARVLAVSPTQYVVSLQTSPNLAPGVYQGQFLIKLCRDPACATQYTGSPLTLPYSLTVTPSTQQALVATPEATLDTTMHIGGSPPRQVRVAVAAADIPWSVNTAAPWIKLSSNTGTGNGTFTVDFLPAGLSSGLHEGEIAVSTASGKRVVLPVKLTLLATAFQTSGNGYDFTAINGAAASAQEITFSLDNGSIGPWTLASDSSWLTVTPQFGTLPGKAMLSANTVSSNLNSGTHTATLTFDSPIGKTNKTVQMTLLKPTLGTSVPNVGFGGTNGRDFSSKPLTLSLNTGNNAWPWKLTSLPAWIKASTTTGNTSDTGSALVLTPEPLLAPMGSTTSLLTSQAQVNGETVTTAIPVTINRDQQKILPSTSGVALVSTPGWSRLTRTVHVIDNYGLGSGWSAASDQNWLNVVRSGDTLTLQANPALLPVDTTSYATVTLIPAVAGATAPEPIRVGLWKGSTTPSIAARIARNYAYVISDPIRPLVYLHNADNTIDAYNVYTGQKTGSVVAPANVTFRDMTVSADGGRLYVPDAFNKAMYVIDLQTLAISSSWPIDITYPRPLVIRPNGVEIVLTHDGAYRGSDGKRLSSFEFGPYKTASQDGRRVYIQSGVSTVQMNAFAVDYSDMGGGTLLLAQVATAWAPNEATNGQDVATSADGARVFNAAGAPYQCGMLDSNLKNPTLLAGGGAYTANVEVDSFERVYCGQTSRPMLGQEDNPDVWIYDANGNLLRSVDLTIGSLLQRQLVVSGDGMVLVGVDEYLGVAIVPVGP